MTKSYTPAELQKEIKRLQAEYEANITHEKKCATYNAAVNEDPDLLKPDFDFLDNMEHQDMLCKRIALYKHLLNAFNTCTTLPRTGITIDQALAILPMLKAQVARLEEYAKRLPRERVENNLRFGSGTSVIDYTYTNYNTERMKELYNKKLELLHTYQLELDEANNIYTIDLDLDVDTAEKEESPSKSEQVVDDIVLF